MRWHAYLNALQYGSGTWDRTKDDGIKIRSDTISLYRNIFTTLIFKEHLFLTIGPLYTNHLISQQLFTVCRFYTTLKQKP
jgi:hypothetical protein